MRRLFASLGRDPANFGACLVLLAFLAIGFWYTLWNPLGEGVDEGAHFKYVWYVKEQRALPVQPWQDNGRPFIVRMGHHPPLYYVLGAIGIAWVDTSDISEVLIPNPHFEWGRDHPRNGWNVYLHTEAESWPWRGTVLAMHVVRVLTLMMGAVALWAVYRTGRLLLPDMPWVAVTGMAWLAFNPSFIFMSSAIHHDALVAALFATGLWWLLRLFVRPFSTREAVVGGLLLGGVMLTKLSGLGLAIVYGVGFLLIALRKRSLRDVLPLAGVTYGLAFLVSGWWYVRNWILYGDPLGWAMFKSTHWHVVRQTPFTWDIFVHEFLYQVAQTFWGAFGFMHITLPTTVWVNFWKVVVALIGIALVAMGIWRKRFFGEGRWALWVLALCGFIVLFASFVRYAVSVGGAGHARYLFPAAAVLVMMLGIGSHALVGFRLRPLVTGLVSLGLASYAVFIPQHFVIPLYPRPETAAEESVEAARRIDVCFADAVCVRAGTLTPGDEIGTYLLTLYWQALPGDRPDLYAHLRLRDSDGTVLLQDEFWPIPSFSTVAWDPGQIYVTRRPVQVPPGTPAGTYVLDLSLTEGQEGAPLPPRKAGTEQGGEFAPLLDLTLDQAVPLAIEADVRRADELEQGVRLLGYSLDKETYHPGDTLRITLYWQPTQTIQPNLVVFVHVLDGQGNLVTQHDSAPREGEYPTPFWQPGIVVDDTHPVPLPPDMPPGEYVLSVGMYDWPGLQRLRVVSGPAAGGDHIVLQTIRVEP